jgi:hypothetical protein
MVTVFRTLGATAEVSAGDAGTYYLNVFALSQKQVIPQTEQTVQADVALPPALSPLVVYAPFFLFFALFITAFGIQVITKTWNFRRMVTAFIIALFAASIPLVLPFIREGIGTQTKAGPDDIPRNIRVVRSANDSAVVVWETGGNRIGAVRYTPAPFDERVGTVVIGDQGAFVTLHTVSLTRLKPGFTYEFDILSGTGWYDRNGKPLRFRFTN